MKYLLIIFSLVLFSCGESESDKQKRLNNELDKNLNDIQEQRTKDSLKIAIDELLNK